jgi:uncharacterized RDD family membrane protein YckC
MSTKGDDWYYATSSDVTNGPVSQGRLQELFDAGSLSWHHSVRHQTWERWYTVREAAGSLGFTGATEQQLPAGLSPQATPSGVIAPFSSGIGKVAGPAAASVAPLPHPIVTPPPAPVVDSPPPAGVILPPLPSASPATPTSVPVAKRVDGTANVSVAAPRQPLSADAVTPIQRVVSWGIDIAAFVVAVLLLNAALPTDFAMLFTFVTYVLYLVVLPVRGHDTLGHLVVGLRVARRVDDGVSPWLVYGTRAAVVLLLAAPFLLGLVASACSMFGHPQAVAWQDVASGTIVVKVKAFEFSRKAALVAVPVTASDVAS